MRSYVEEERLKWIRRHPNLPTGRYGWRLSNMYPNVVRQVYEGKVLYAWIEKTNPSLSDYIEIVWDE